MLYKYIIFDGQNLYWRSVLSSIKKCLDSEDSKIYSNSIKDFLNRINEFKLRFGEKESKIYILFDNPTSIINKRKSIDVEYKHTREEKNVPRSFYKTLDSLQEILKVYNNNLYIANCDGLEADDLVYPVIRYINEEKNNDNKLVISADMDWGRSLGLDYNLNWYNYVDIFDINSFKEKYGFSPDGKKIQMYKAIHGDNSDAIPNAVPYLPKEILFDIVENYDNLDHLFSSLSKFPEKWKIKIKEAENRIRINYRLADFFIYNSIENFLFSCKEDLKMLRFYFELYEIEFETRMFENNVQMFFAEKRKYNQLKRK